MSFLHVKVEPLNGSDDDGDSSMPAVESKATQRRGLKRKAAPSAPLVEEPLSEHDESRAKRIAKNAENRRLKLEAASDDAAPAAAAARSTRKARKKTSAAAKNSEDEASAADDSDDSDSASRSSSDQSDSDGVTAESPAKKRRVAKGAGAAAAPKRKRKAAPKRKPKVKAKNPVMADPEPIVPIEDGTARTVAPRVLPFSNILPLSRLQHDFDHLDINMHSVDRCKTPGQAQALSKAVVEEAARRVASEGYGAVKRVKQEAAVAATAAAGGGGSGSGSSSKEEKKEAAAAASDDGADPLDATSRADTEDRKDSESKRYNRMLQEAMDALEIPQFKVTPGMSESSQEQLVEMIRDSQLDEPVLGAATIQLLLVEAGSFVVDGRGTRLFPECARAKTSKGCSLQKRWGWAGVSLMLDHEITALMTSNAQPKCLRQCYICYLDTVGHFMTVMRNQQRSLHTQQIVAPFSVITEGPNGFHEDCCWQFANSSGRYEGLVGNFPMFRPAMFREDRCLNSVQRYLDHSAMAWKMPAFARPDFGEKLSTF